MRNFWVTKGFAVLANLSRATQRYGNHKLLGMSGLTRLWIWPKNISIKKHGRHVRRNWDVLMKIVWCSLATCTARMIYLGDTVRLLGIL